MISEFLVLDRRILNKFVMTCTNLIGDSCEELMREDIRFHRTELTDLNGNLIVPTLMTLWFTNAFHITLSEPVFISQILIF